MTIKVAIDFRLEDPRQGIGTAVLALAHGLSRLENYDQEYVFLVYDHSVDWLRPYVSGPCSIVPVPSGATPKWRFKHALKQLPGIQTAWRWYRPPYSTLPGSDGAAERLGCHLVHFPTQQAYATGLPSIYQPWDLQHCHYPHFFTKEELLKRNSRYPGFCHRARKVCVTTEWGKQDLVTQYQIDPSKIEVIPFGSAFEAYQPPSLEEVEAVKRKFDLPERFLIYPAVTWPHKNHETLIRSLSLLKSAHGTTIDLYFTGASTELKTSLVQLAANLGQEKAIHFLGFVDAAEIQSLFHLATALVFPSKFEGLGLPVLEAFRAGLPVACAAATVLPEVAADAALFFNPDSEEEIAAAVHRLLNSSDLRADLVSRGKLALERFSADGAALRFADLYERIVQSAAAPQ